MVETHPFVNARIQSGSGVWPEKKSPVIRAFRLAPASSSAAMLRPARPPIRAARLTGQGPGCGTYPGREENEKEKNLPRPQMTNKAAPPP